MAKKFMYVCFGVLALAVTFHVGARYGRAETIVDQTTTCIVATCLPGYGVALVLLDNGEVWEYDVAEGWVRTTYLEPPILPSDNKFWRWDRFVSSSNELWATDHNGIWRNYGAPPIGPSAIQPTTWGKIKTEWGVRSPRSRVEKEQCSVVTIWTTL